MVAAVGEVDAERVAVGRGVAELVVVVAVVAAVGHPSAAFLSYR